MKRNTFILALTLVAALFSACKKDKNGSGSKPVVNPASTFTVVADGKTYNMKIDAQSTKLGDSAHFFLVGSLPEVSVRLSARSVSHVNGVGEYFLLCCSNDIFEKFSGSQKHWETDHAGENKQVGFVKITRMDEKGYEGTYLLDTKDGTSNLAVRKQFTGSFNIIY